MQDDPLEDVIEDNGIFEEIVDVADIGDAASVASPFGIDYAKITFWEFFFGVDDVKAWNVDLEEFFNDGEGDPVPAVTPKTIKNFYQDSLKFLSKQPVSIIVGGLAFVCLLVVVVSLILLICLFLGYV